LRILWISVPFGHFPGPNTPTHCRTACQTYGLDSFAQIEAIRYSRNGQLNGMNVSRSWVWEPKTNRVTYEGKDKDGKPVKLTCIRSKAQQPTRRREKSS
jgi:hypothetical protein